MEAQLRSRSVVRFDAGRSEAGEDTLVEEVPLEIVVGDSPFAVVMRTPGSEVAHALGLLLGEGLISKMSDVRMVDHCRRVNRNRILVTLTPEAAAGTPRGAFRRSFLSQSSCGLCGKTVVDEISSRLGPCDRPGRADPQRLFRHLAEMTARQELRRATRGTHAVALFDTAQEMVAFAEDVGRHNALDKVIGQALLSARLADCEVCIASSRASFEMVQKAACAGIPILATVSAPTGLAVELADRAGLTLVSFLREGSLRAYTRAERVLEAVA
jgi:FdhD protein